MPVTTAALLDSARARLAGAPQEGLGRERASRWRGTRIVPAGTAWHLGVLLLTEEQAFATAEVLRAAEQVRRGYSAESARARATRREQARRAASPRGRPCTSDGPRSTSPRSMPVRHPDPWRSSTGCPR
ncbi:hypothetical protein [Microbacterium sp. NIBRBAC000506063]|uniref:hypothetical protein n=1 Tax=Microbacterium sp. NIBRBAC000506063 TaxID=2734618 RepID=UPI001CB71F44|nr:hypothetical protein [Microbacterium sp. NIBRBAC000506063]